jgi:ring-1,2-phenylacetyl-CoA epoxidase subunit PaaD
VVTALTTEEAWEVLRHVPDPEIPAISVTDLGIVRDVRVRGDGLDVVVTPTYSGCPATEVIERSIRDALTSAGAREVHVETRLAPPWTTDWITADARERLRAYGIAPPGACSAAGTAPLTFTPLIECPRCGSRATERLSQFGSTACKALYRCRDCLEPFEYFKPI